MPTFTPPTVNQGSGDHFFGRYSIPVGQSVVKVDGVFRVTPYPWLGDIAHLTEGVEWFGGGRTYTISDAVAAQLEADGFTTEDDLVTSGGFGLGPFGFGPFGG